jgi:hypothetical protein
LGGEHYFASKENESSSDFCNRTYARFLKGFFGRKFNRSYENNGFDTVYTRGIKDGMMTVDKWEKMTAKNPDFATKYEWRPWNPVRQLLGIDNSTRATHYNEYANPVFYYDSKTGKVKQDSVDLDW